MYLPLYSGCFYIRTVIRYKKYFPSPKKCGHNFIRGALFASIHFLREERAAPRNMGIKVSKKSKKWKLREKRSSKITKISWEKKHQNWKKIYTKIFEVWLFFKILTSKKKCSLNPYRILGMFEVEGGFWKFWKKLKIDPPYPQMKKVMLFVTSVKATQTIFPKGFSPKKWTFEKPQNFFLSLKKKGSKKDPFLTK